MDKMKIIKFICICMSCLLFTACENTETKTGTLKEQAIPPIESQRPLAVSATENSKEVQELYDSPLLYADATNFGKINEVHITGGFKNGIFLHWSKFLFEDYNKLVDKCRQSEPDSIIYVKNKLIQNNTKFRLYNLITKECYQGRITSMPYLPSISSDEDSFNLTAECEIDGADKLSDGYYIGILGDWNAFPSQMYALDQLGSISVDADLDGKQEIIHAEKLFDKEMDTSYMQFTLEHNGKKYVFDQIYYTGENEYTWNYKIGEIPENNKTYAFVIPMDVNGDGKMEFITLSEENSYQVNINSLEDTVEVTKRIYYVGPA